MHRSSVGGVLRHSRRPAGAMSGDRCGHCEACKNVSFLLFSVCLWISSYEVVPLHLLRFFASDFLSISPYATQVSHFTYVSRSTQAPYSFTRFLLFATNTSRSLLVHANISQKQASCSTQVSCSSIFPHQSLINSIFTSTSQLQRSQSLCVASLGTTSKSFTLCNSIASLASAQLLAVAQGWFSRSDSKL